MTKKEKEAYENLERLANLSIEASKNKKNYGEYDRKRYKENADYIKTILALVKKQEKNEELLRGKE